MKQYKTVAGPVMLVIKKNDSYEDAVKQYAAIIDREAVGGWELELIQQIPVYKNKGCLAQILSLFNLTTAYELAEFNMLVFSKEN